MERVFWSLAVVAAFVVGSVAGGSALRDRPPETVQRLRDQVTALQARLDARDDEVAPRRDTSSAPGASSWSDLRAEGPPGHRVLSAVLTNESAPANSAAPRDAIAPPWDRVVAGQSPRGAGSVAPGVDTALARFRSYMEATSGGEGREQWRRARELVNELRAMGEPAANALMQVLASGQDSDERRAAARLLGTLQIPQSLPLLRDIIDRDDDLLLRRAAAAGLRQLQTPEALPVMERIVGNLGEDRFVRLSAAAGLADAGRPLGVNALTHIFDESTADGRGRDLAFRALTALNDERPLPFMRQLVTAQAEPGYRLRAIKYVTAQGDVQALGALQAVMSSSREQPSIRDAAAQAYTTLSGK